MTSSSSNKNGDTTERIIRLTRVTPIDDSDRAGCGPLHREAWLLTRLAFTLMGYLGTSTRWMIMLSRLVTFVMVLFPAFVRLMLWFITSVRSGHVIRSLRYGPNARNALDIYLPTHLHSLSQPSLHQLPQHKKAPVVVFVSGGAWTIGYKGWGGLMGRIMMNHGILFVTPDYRNFPQGNMSHMLDDIDAAMAWVFTNIGSYGGDVNNIYLMGQSAGAHLTCMAMLNQVRRAYEMSVDDDHPLINTGATDDDDSTHGGTDPRGVFPPPTMHIPPASAPSHRHHTSPNSYPSPRFKLPASPISSASPLSPSSPSVAVASVQRVALSDTYRWRASDLRGYLGISGPYDLVPFLEHLERRGINRRLFTSIVGGDERALPLYSPFRILNDLRVFTRPSSPSPFASSPSSDDSTHIDTSTSMMTPSSTAATEMGTFYSLPEVQQQFPPIRLYHGSNDMSVPMTSSQLLCGAFQSCGINASFTCYRGKSHTDPILEDPMSGCDPLLTDIISLILGQPTKVQSPRLINQCAIACARAVNPF